MLKINKFKLIIIFCLTFASTVFLFKLYYTRVSIYNYNVKADYLYNFDHSNVHVNILPLQENKVNINNYAYDGATNFIMLSIKATFIGKFIEPQIIVTSNDKTIIQTVERSCTGIRYVNISSLHITKGRDISIYGNHLSIDDQTIKIISFKNNEDISKSKILIIAPHPDDAEIAAYGLYNNRSSYVITVTAGENGNPLYDEVYNDKKTQHITTGKMRVWNSITIPLLGNIKSDHLINLGYFDGTLQSMYKREKPILSKSTGIKSINYFRKPTKTSFLTRKKLPEPSWESLVEDIKNIINNIQPDIIVTPYPAIDSHDDHKYTTIAVIESLLSIKFTKGSLFLYTNHLPQSEFFPFGSSGETLSIPPAFEQIYFNSIYSYQLSANEQIEKNLALDAMNDLRPNIKWNTLNGNFHLLLGLIKNVVTGKNPSYFRRAIRSNELFFVIHNNRLSNKEVLNQLVLDIKSKNIL